MDDSIIIDVEFSIGSNVTKIRLLMAQISDLLPSNTACLPNNIKLPGDEKVIGCILNYPSTERISPNRRDGIPIFFA